MILMVRSYAGICNSSVWRRGSEVEAEENQSEMYGRAETAERGTVWSRNKCGLCRITAMRDADGVLADKMMPTKNRER